MTTLLLSAQQAPIVTVENGFDWVALLVGGLAFVGAVFGTVLAGWNTAKDRRERRRHELARQYGEALATALAWAELPYRVARRTSDDAEVLREQANHFHALQEKILFHQQWLRLESPDIGERYALLVTAVKAQTDPHIRAAWARSPVQRAEDMNLGSPFSCDVSDECGEFLGAVRRKLRFD